MKSLAPYLPQLKMGSVGFCRSRGSIRQKTLLYKGRQALREAQGGLMGANSGISMRSADLESHLSIHSRCPWGQRQKR